MRRVEAFERRKFQDRFDLAFEENRQDNDIRRARLPQTGAHLYVTVGHIGQENALFFQRRLPNQTLTEFEAILCASPLAVRVAHQELKFRLFIRVVDDIKHAVLRGNYRGEL